MALPNTISNLVHWLKADVIGQSGATDVTKWADLSGYGHDVYAIRTSGTIPTYQTSVINSRPVVRFDGTLDQLGASNAPMYQSTQTVFAVVKNDQTTGQQTIRGGADGGLQFRMSENKINFVKQSVADIGSSLTNIGTGWQVLSGEFSDNSYYRFWQNGVDDGGNAHAVTLGLDANAMLGQSWIGRYGGFGTGEYMDGDIAEVIIYDKALSVSERETVMAYLRGQYALTSYKKVSLTDVAWSSWAGGSTSCAPAYPSGVASGDEVYLVVHTKPDTVTPSTPANFSSVGSVTGGSGSQGVGTGPTRITVFKRLASAAHSGTFTVTCTGASCCQASTIKFRAAGTNRTYSEQLGSWSNTTATTNPGGTTGTMHISDKDMLVGIFGVTDDSPTGVVWDSVTRSPCTFGSIVAAPGGTSIGTGNDMTSYKGYTEVQAKEANAGVAVSGTLGAGSSTETNVGAILRVSAYAEVDASTDTLPAVGAGDNAVLALGATFTRTMAVFGASITGWSWDITTAPGGASTGNIGTAAALSWTPTVAGTYVLGATATNATGTSIQKLITVVVHTDSRLASYRYFRFDCVQTTNPGDAAYQLAELEIGTGFTEPSALPSGSSIEGTSDYPGGSGPDKLYDLSYETQLRNSPAGSAVLDFGSPLSAYFYRWTTARDYAIYCDPTDWTLAGSTDGSNWHTLDTRSSYAPPFRRFTSTEWFPLLGPLPVTLGLITDAPTINPLARQKKYTLGAITGAATLYPLDVTLVTGATLITLGLITDAPTVNALSRSKTRTLGLITGTATVNALARKKTYTLGLITDAPTVNALSRSKTRTLGLITATATINALSRSKTRTLGLITATATINPIKAVHGYTLGLITGTATVNALSRSKTRTLGLITGTATINALSRQKTYTLGLITDAPTVNALSRSKTRALGLITAASTINPIKAVHSYTLGLITGTATVNALKVAHGYTLGLITGTATVNPLSRQKVFTLGLITDAPTLYSLDITTSRPATNIDLGLITDAPTVNPLSRQKVFTLGLITDTASLYSLQRSKTRTLGLITATATVNALSRSKTRTLGLITDTASLYSLQRSKTYTLGLITDAPTLYSIDIAVAGRTYINLAPITDAPTVNPLHRQKTYTLGSITAPSSLSPLSWTKRRTLGSITGAATLYPLSWTKTRTLGLVTGTATVNPLSRQKLRALGTIVDAATLNALSRQKGYTLGSITSTATIYPLSRQKTHTLGLITGTATLYPLRYSPATQIVLGLITSTATINALSWRKYRTLGQIIDAPTLNPLTLQGLRVLGLITDHPKLFSIRVQIGVPFGLVIPTITVDVSGQPVYVAFPAALELDIPPEVVLIDVSPDAMTVPMPENLDMPLRW